MSKCYESKPLIGNEGLYEFGQREPIIVSFFRLDYDELKTVTYFQYRMDKTFRMKNVETDTNSIYITKT